LKLTVEYINSYRTEKGAFTRKQVEALGLEWPPSSGWIRRIAGTEITDDQAREFEAGRVEFKKGGGDPTSKQLQMNVNFICKHIDLLTEDQKNQLASALA